MILLIFELYIFLHITTPNVKVYVIIDGIISIHYQIVLEFNRVFGFFLTNCYSFVSLTT